MDTYSYISENGVIREIADVVARTKNSEQDLSINEVTLKTNRLAGYSESETQVGTWIDGRPIYRKVFNLKKALNYNTHLEIPFLDVITNIGVLYSKTYNNSCIPIVYAENRGLASAYVTLLWSNGGTFEARDSWWVEYTKAT